MTILIPVLVALIGALAYALSNNPKVAELGRISFFAGLLVAVLECAGRAVSLLGR